MSYDLMAYDSFDYFLVVASEETDWLLCDAYRKWRLLRAAPPIEPFQQPPRGTIFSEGAGALLLFPERCASAGRIRIAKISSGTNFKKQQEAGGAVGRVFAELCTDGLNLVS